MHENDESEDWEELGSVENDKLDIKVVKRDKHDVVQFSQRILNIDTMSNEL